jgi:hypothetical protein
MGDTILARWLTTPKLLHADFGAGHLSPLEAPDTLADTCRGFLESL